MAYGRMSGGLRFSRCADTGIESIHTVAAHKPTSAGATRSCRIVFDDGTTRTLTTDPNGRRYYETVSDGRVCRVYV